MSRIALHPIAAAAVLAATLTCQSAAAQTSSIDQRAAAIEQQAIAWRRDIHQNPELGNREFRTSKLVAEHLSSRGLEVQTGVAHTGVVGLLRGGKPGPVVALRAEKDALPVTEESTLPFATKAKGSFEGKEVGSRTRAGTTGIPRS